jgi:hypothetical protein
MAKTTRSYGFEADDLAWLEAEAKRLDVSVSWLLRKLVREARAAVTTPRVDDTEAA